VHPQLLSIDLSGTDLAIIIPIIGAQIVAVVVAWRTGNKVTSVDAKLVTRNGASVASQIDDLTTMQVLATPPQERTPAMISHLEAAKADPATDASLMGNGAPAAPPKIGG
jgi:hypothetical protein